MRDFLDKTTPYACKVIERSQLSAKGERLTRNEIFNLHSIERSTESSGVIRFVKTYKTHQAYYIVTEYCNGGDVSSMLKAKGGQFNEDVSRLILSKIVN